MPRLPLLLSLLLLSLPALAQADTAADASWATVTELDRPPQSTARNREEARAAGLAHLSQQEAALRSFISRHPKDPRAIDARLRLAHLYTVRSDFTESSADNAAALKVLEELDRIAPENRRADVAFARLSLTMRNITIPTDRDRDNVAEAIHAFQRKYPNDRRIAALLTELANLYDHQPKRKERYLQQALALARTEEMKARIHDDLRRISFLGQPLPLEGKSPDGRRVAVSQFKGKVVVVYFVASWSPPSIAAMEEVNYLRRTFPENRLVVIGVSLDQTPEAFAATTARATGNWHWIWEQQGWESPTIRSLGINALPLLWIVDRKGRLRTVNSRTDSEPLVNTLIREN